MFRFKYILLYFCLFVSYGIVDCILFTNKMNADLSSIANNCKFLVMQNQFLLQSCKEGLEACQDLVPDEGFLWFKIAFFVFVILYDVNTIIGFIPPLAPAVVNTSLVDYAPFATLSDYNASLDVARIFSNENLANIRSVMVSRIHDIQHCTQYITNELAKLPVDDLMARARLEKFLNVLNISNSSTTAVYALGLKLQTHLLYPNSYSFSGEELIAFLDSIKDYHDITEFLFRFKRFHRI